MGRAQSGYRETTIEVEREHVVGPGVCYLGGRVRMHPQSILSKCPKGGSEGVGEPIEFRLFAE